MDGGGTLYTGGGTVQSMKREERQYRREHKIVAAQSSPD